MKLTSYRLWLFFLIFSNLTNTISGQYCIPSSTFGPAGNIFIDAVGISDMSVNRTGGIPGTNYIDNTSTMFVLDTLSQNELRITAGLNTDNVWYYAWIDYNKDEDFDDAGELLGQVQLSQPAERLTFLFSVPDGALTGSTRLRVTCANVTNLNPCDAYEYGETEDYTVNTTPVFSDVGLNENGNGTSEWGDYDNDGDLDILLSGNGGATRIFKNNGNDIFTDINVNFITLWSSDRTWGDYDNDGDLDIAIIGEYDGLITSVIFRNDGGDAFTEINANLTGVYEGSCAWGDYNNDGRLDLLISGLDVKDEPVAVLYRNDGSDSFVDSEIDITPCVTGEVDWGDFDNDEFIDILMVGRDFDGNFNTEIYRNDGKGNFSSINSGFPNTAEGQVEFGDYDGDGDLDVALCGNLTYGRIFKNNGPDSDGFIDINAGLPKLSNSSLDWGDYDNDGDLDLIFCGHNELGIQAFLYENIGSDVFVESEGPAIGNAFGSVTFGDYDKDNDLDILLSGQQAHSSHTYVFRNDNLSANSFPSSPTGLLSKVIHDGAFLSWNQATDSETPSAALSYNVRIASYVGGVDILSPMSDVNNGYRKLAKNGNAGLDTDYYIRNLPVGKYYWSVQSVDGSFQGSPFSAEDSFEIIPTVSPIQFKFPYLKNGDMAWGDYNNDGFQDLLMTGDDIAGKFTTIYKNNGDYTFDSINPHIPGIYNGSVAWGDYDNDSDLDILINGNTGSYPDYFPLAKVFRNDGEDVFTEINAEMTGIAAFFSEWADIDNDGDLDVIIFGYHETGLYRNEGNDVFTSIPEPELYYSGLFCIGDFDNDFDLDLVVGESGKARIWRNIGKAQFEMHGEELPFFEKGSLSFGDADNDNDLDLLSVGLTDRNNTAKVYSNEGNGYFIDKNAGLRGVSESRALWGDFNNDGYSDILYTGFSGVYISKLYLNDQNGNFSDIELDLIASIRGRISCVDVENDGDLDFLITSFATDSSTLYRNNMNFPELSPFPPENLESESQGLGIVFSWDPPANIQNNESSLSYNIRVGSESLSADIMSPMTLTPTSSKRLIPAMGNAQLNTGWKIDSLAVGKYYWSVQAITPAFAGGEWAVEDSFSIAQMRPFFGSNVVCFGDSTAFTDGTLVTGTEIESWQWDFGDGNNSIVQNPKHIYALAGNYSASLTVTDTAGVSIIETNSVIVLPAPEVSFEADIVCQGVTTTFTNTTSSNGLNINQWFWDFGNGVSSEMEDPVFNGYLKAGDYSVQLNAYADNGCSDSISKIAVVGNIPEAKILSNGDSFCEGDSIILSADYYDSYIYQWKIGESNLTDGDSSEYITKIKGDYTLEVTNADGYCSSTSDTLTVKTISYPVIPVIVSENYIADDCMGDLPIELSVDIPETGINYEWNFYGTPQGEEDSYEGYLREGYYTVVADREGCESVSEIFTISYGDMLDKPEIIAEGPVVWYLACSNDSAEYYRWYYEGNRLEGATDYLYLAGQQLGKYEVSISNNGECFAMSDPMWIPLSTGIDEDPFQNLKIYPNPTPGLFTLEMDNPIMGDLIIDIFGESGSKIINIKFLKEINHFSTQIDLGEQPGGVYLINLFLEKHSASRKLIVE